MSLILASESPRRRELLGRLVKNFTVSASHAGELKECADVYWMPVENAVRKCMAVAERFPESFVLGADTIVVLDHRPLGKPRSSKEAFQFLRDLSGRTHEVVTALALCCQSQGIRSVWSEKSFVRFKRYDDAVIAQYLRQVPVLDKAGAYAIQDHGDLLVSSFDGELENIIGLPLGLLKKRLQEFHLL